LVAAKQEAIISGSWDVFHGPIVDQNGKEVVPAGSKMSDPDMLNMNFFVEGVIGKTGN
jgi:basic membrane protein A